MTHAGPDRHPSTSALLARLRSGDTRALARAISLVEDNAAAAVELLEACRASESQSPHLALRIGVTGPPGAGKSTLVDRLVHAFRATGKTVAVLAIDPSSPYTGGALLGDRIRMQSFAGDEGVYIRSMASRGATGGLAASASDACAVIAAAGRDVILIETVGAGQAEIEIARLANVTLVVLVPGMGDEVQSLKAGILEIADIFVINKADLDGADRMEAEILAMQSLAPTHAEQGTPPLLPPIVRTIATTGQGIGELFAALNNQINHSAGALETTEKVVVLKGRDFSPAISSQSLNGALAPGGILVSRDTGIRQPGLQSRLDHLGIAVRSIAAARTFYASLGLAVTHEQTVEHEQVKTAMLPIGDTRLELLEPIGEDSTDSAIARFLAKRGPGLHHIAIRLNGIDANIDALFQRLRAQGVRLASECIRTGAGGHRYFFIHPESTGGVLLEIVADPNPQEAPHPLHEAAAE